MFKEIVQAPDADRYHTQEELVKGDECLVVFNHYPLDGHILDISRRPDGAQDVTVMFTLGTVETFVVSSLN